jgi:charged multivesicular body protein 3
MAKAGLIEEMMNDSLDSALGDEELEDETEEEVAKVLQEVAGEVLAAMPDAKKAQVGRVKGF